MSDITESAVADLVEAGVLAFKNRDYQSAVTYLQQALDLERLHWRAKLYLAMSLYHGGEFFTAYRHLLFLRDNCTDSEIKKKAEAAIAAMTAEMSTKTAMPEMTCTLKKPVLKRPPAEDDSAFNIDDGVDINWVR